MLISLQFVPILATMQLPKLVEPTPLTSPSPFLDFLSSALFESPGAWILASVLLIAALALLTRPHKKLKYGGGVLLLLAVLVALAQQFVTTNHEEIIKCSRAAVLAVAKADTPALGKLLTPEFQAKYFQFPQGLNREQVIIRATELFATNPAEVSFGELRAVVDNQRFARAQVLVTGRHSSIEGLPFTAWWTISFEKTVNGWQLTGAEMTSPSKLGY